ncbi:hypothetical protein KBY66_12745 [Synechococcus sp. Tobar12-5m-g]|uniref:hypothetical protein n=1 Tax=unclassified Synechococcus TaxID=2626047 RepID=UPI0020CFCC9E|nr:MULTISPECIES: hypothetical protein [unclassified Synechococcus]MCP9773472.1 hypothetical protein [Synechococcus sp. Tobar12-5m-g]MCP9874470.1 hypothetical protein [Synechococcus sp. Cruz CV-v-12]
MAQPIQPPRRSSTSTERFTLVFKNGERLLHQDPIALAQFRFDGRLASVWREPDGQVFVSRSLLRGRELSS